MKNQTNTSQLNEPQTPATTPFDENFKDLTPNLTRKKGDGGKSEPRTPGIHEPEEEPKLDTPRQPPLTPDEEAKQSGLPQVVLDMSWDIS